MEQNETQKTKNKKEPWWRKSVRILGRTVLIIFILLVLLLLFVRSPWGQDIIVGKLTQYVSNKTHTEVSIDEFFVTFSGKINVEGLYIEDQQGDTLIYSRDLEAGIPLWPILTGGPISINRVEWNGLAVNINRQDSSEGFNYHFLIEAFASDSTTAQPEPTQSEPLEIAIGSIHLSDFKIDYHDAVTGMKVYLNLGEFYFQGENIDLQKMKFEIEEIALTNTTLSYLQTKPTPQEADTAKTASPFLSVDKITLENVNLYYKSIPAGITADTHLSDFLLELPKADLADKNIRIGQIALNNSAIKVETRESGDTSKTSTTEAESDTTQTSFSWPDWNVRVETIAFEDNHLIYQSGEKPEDISGFNPDYINMRDFTLKVDDIFLSEDKKLQADLNEFSFRQASGLALKQLNFVLEMNSRQFSINDFDVNVNHSSFAADLAVQYQSIGDFIGQPMDSRFAIDLSRISLDLNDLFQLQPDLKSNEYLKKLSRKKLTGQIKANGSLAKMKLPKFLIKWGKNIRLKTHGQFKHLANPDSLWMDIEQFSFKTTKKNITALIPEDSLGVTVPKSITLNSQIHGRLNDLTINTQLVTSDGSLKLNGHYKNSEKIAFNANLSIDSLALGKILQNPQIGQIAMTLTASGQGSSLYDLTAKLNTDFSKLKLAGYDFSALELSGKMEDGQGSIKLAHKDRNLDLDIHSTFKIDSTAQNIAVTLDLNGSDLQALGLTNRALKAGLLMTAHINLQDGKIDFKSQIDEGMVVYQNEAYPVGQVNIAALLYKDSTSVDIHSNFLNSKLRSNANLADVTQALEHQLKRYFADSTQSADSLKQPLRVKLKMRFHPTELLTNVFLPSIQQMDTLKLGMDFNQKKKLLTASMYLPELNYAGNIIKDLGFKITSTSEAGQFAFGFEQLDAGAFTMNTTYLNGDLKEGVLTVKFNSVDDKGNPFYAIETQISGISDKLKIHMNPDSLLVKGNTWHIPEDNKLLIQNDKITARHFVFSYNKQQIKIADDLIDLKKNNMGIRFQNFSLSNIMALFNSDNYLAEGQLQGDIVAVNPLGRLGVVADFGVDSLHILQVPIGRLNLNAVSQKKDHYKFSMDLKGSDVNLALQGNYIAAGKPHFNLRLDINKFGFETIDKLADESLKKGNGYVSGKITAQGPVASPEYSGFIAFNDASLKMTNLNSTFYLTDDRITFNNEEIVLDDFSIADVNHHRMVIDGSISTENITDPKFDLSLSADNFQLMSSTKKAGTNYYGTINFDINGTIAGRMSFPKVDLNLRLNKNTNFTYLLSSSKAAMQSREGIVKFVNKAQPKNILTRDGDSTNVSKITGIQLHAQIHTDPAATFSVILNPRTGDNFEISGEGALDFNIAPNGQMTLTGRYTVTNGHYKMSLFNLVKRKFYLQKGSTITWNGDPLGARLDVTAIYKLETSASGLMAARMAGASSSEQNKYKQVLPFWVLMRIDGTINKPALSFDLTMPEEAQGAAGGAVFARVNQLSQNPSALNKQVFSLLVLNRFYPVPGSDGSEGGVARIARNNINSLLSDQLNAFADRLMGDTGVMLDFGLESYTDYQGQSAQNRTELNISAKKALFNDRLVVEAGTDINVQGETKPGEENPLLGNVSIAYLLTKDGRWRIKGFRKNEYENIIDGQIFINGISLVFQYQFNQFRELWKSFFGEEVMKNKQAYSSDEKEAAKTTKNNN